ncbi:hypothetical protein ACWGI9_15305 [Streptomyces sp. NPDC054833]
MALDGVGVIDFQLYLLKVMDPPAALLESSLKKLNRTEVEMDDRQEAVSQLIRLGAGSARKLVVILEQALVDASGASEQRYVYRLPLWPDFKFLVSLDGSGRFIESMEFESDGDCGEGAKIVPWGFLETWLGVNFDQVRMIDGWGHYRTYMAQSSDNEEVFLRFAWGLLQEVSTVR